MVVFEQGWLEKVLEKAKKEVDERPEWMKHLRAPCVMSDERGDC